MSMLLRGPGVLRCTPMAGDRTQVVWHEWFHLPGGALGRAAWSLLWPGAPAGAYAMLGAAAFIGAATQAPLAGLVLVLTHSGVDLLVPMILAAVVATAVARWIDGYSIYSA